MQKDAKVVGKSASEDPEKPFVGVIDSINQSINPGFLKWSK